MAAILAISWSAIQPAQAQTNGNIEGTVMQIHNNERASVNVPSLSWSDKLAADAQSYAEHLLTLGLGPRDILPHATGTGQGENLSWGTPGFYKVAEGVQQWADEKSNYKGTPISNDDFRPGVPMIGHFTQMVWKDTKQVGCGTASSSTLEVLVCRYSPPGNFIGELPYNTGASSANQAVTDDQNTFAPSQEKAASANTNGDNSGGSGKNNNGDNSVNTSGDNNGGSGEGGTGK